MMREEFVRRRGWVSDQRFADLLGATNLIPGPNSTELAIHLGYDRARWRGLIAAGACFILPAALMVTALAWAYVRFGDTPAVEGILYGIVPVVIAIIVYAVIGLLRSVVKGVWLGLLAVAALVAYLLGVNELILLVAGAAVAVAANVTLWARRDRLHSFLAAPLITVGGQPVFAGGLEWAGSTDSSGSRTRCAVRRRSSRPRAPHAATSGTYRMHLVITVPGHPSFAVDDQFIVKVKKWPSPGQSVPVEASQSDPTRFKILWDEIPDWDVGAAAQAQQLASAMNQQPAPPPEGHSPTWQAGTPMVMINGRPATPEELKQYEAMTGMDLDGDGRIAGGAAAPGGGLQGLIAGAMAAAQPGQRAGPADQPGAADDRVSAIERLVALKASGALTEAEFEAEKARILGGS
jgi:chromate transport protein ChrA